MELHHAGVVALGVAQRERAIAPQALAPIEAIDGDSTTTNDAPSSPRRYPEVVITLPEQEYPLPDAETVATMQLLLGIDGRDR